MDFITTHKRKKDGLEASLLSIADDKAVYRIRFRQGRDTVTRVTSRDAALFDADFEVAA